jgi:hypothetical protein
MEVRAALTTTTSDDWSAGTTYGGAEIQKKVEEMPIEAFNKMTDLAKLLPRKNINQLAYFWNLVEETVAGSGVANSSFLFYAEGASGTPAATSKVQLAALTKSYRTDYEVTGLMIAAGMGNQLAEEARFAAEALAVGEEKSIICGTATSAYGFSGSFLGLLQLMGSYASFAETTTVYGIARASGKTYLDVGVVRGAAAAADALSLDDLDAALTTSNKRGGKGSRRIYFCSEDRVDEIAQLLQPQQRFNSPTIEFDGGFRVLSYKGIPIIGSRFMDKNGLTSTGANSTATYADQAMYLLDLNHIFMVHVAGVNAVHVPVVSGAHTASTSQLGADVVGGFYKSYGVLVMDRFDTQVIIMNLTDI